jgi:hypothetical protein
MRIFHKDNTVVLFVLAIFVATLFLVVLRKTWHLPQRYTVETICVVQGHEFDLQLTNGKRIHARLKVKTPAEAKDQVVEYINNSERPEVIVYKEDNDIWIVDLLFDGMSLTEWLRSHKLVWE